MCSNGWNDVTAALQLLSHLDGDALNIALLVPESRRVKPGFLIKSLSEHYNSPGRLAEYKRQFQRAFRRPGDDPSIFATELQTLARRAFMDIDLKIQSQMVRDRFIDGQAECALCRHLDSLGPNAPIPDIVDCCRIWERHCEVEIQPQTGTDRRPVRVIGQVTEVEPTPAVTLETETVVNMIKKLLPTPAPLPLRASPIRSDRNLLIQQLMKAICPPTLVAQERSPAEDLETLLLNWLPAGTVTEEDVVFTRTVNRFRQGVLFVRGIDPYDGRMPDSRRVVSVFAYGTAGGTHSGTGSPTKPLGTADGKRQLIWGKGLVARISDDYRPQLPVVGMDIPEPAVPCHVGIARLEETVNNRTRLVGRVVRRPYSDSEESDNDVWYAEVDDSALGQPTVDLCSEGCAHLDDFKWFLPTDEWAGDLSAPDSEIEASDSESGVQFRLLYRQR